MTSTPTSEPFEGPGRRSPDEPAEAVFWAVPGVDPPRGATPARTPGSAGVDGYRPVSGPRVEA
ncbi:MAG: hypothetical protein LBK59_08240, partial [Bifidobacteriaceae bacterium]|nr:hypothetical protein [Bifidobacteriaceae bacterium]